MAFCGSCGAQAQNGVKFCPSCGASISTAGEAASYQRQYQTPSAAGGAPRQQTDPNDAEQNKTMALLAYILFFIPLLTGDHKKSPFVKFHTNQGTVNIVAAIAYAIACAIASAILAFIPVIGWIVALLLPLGSLLFLVFAIMGIVNAMNGKTAPLPVIGKFTIIK